MSVLGLDHFTPAHTARKTGPGADFAADIAVPAVVAPFARNEEIYAAEEANKFIYRVISGAVRLIRILPDGRRHISAFYLPGEIFGVEPGARRRFCAEAITDTQIAMVRRASVEERAEEDPRVACTLWRLAARDLEHVNEHMLLLGRMSAMQRVIAFLIEIAARTGHEDDIALPMSRSDIADYLGLTIETVSRTLTHLERQGAIRLPTARRVILRDKLHAIRIDA